MESTIKSARRVLELFEHFAEKHEPATVSELATRLGYPQSSTSVLLKSLLTLGYLQYDEVTRRYRPTMRVMLLGSWVHDEILGQSSVMSKLEKLHHELGHSVIVGMLQGIHVRYVVTLCGEQSGLPQFPTGTLRPACRAAVGKILLARRSNTQISLIVRRTNAQEADPDHRLMEADVLADIERCRRRGWAESQGSIVSGRNVIAVDLPSIPGQPEFAIGLGGPEPIMDKQRQRIIERLREFCIWWKRPGGGYDDPKAFKDFR